MIAITQMIAITKITRMIAITQVRMIAITYSEIEDPAALPQEPELDA